MFTAEILNKTPNIVEPTPEQMLAYYSGKRLPRYTLGWPSVDFGLLRGQVVAISGYGNNGKGTFARQMALQMHKLHGIKWAFWSPEDMPCEYFYADLIHTLTGKSTESHHSNFISESEYKDAYKYLLSCIKLIDYDDTMPNNEQLFEQFDRMHKEHGCDGFVIDPFNNVDIDFDAGRDDNIIRKIGLAARAWTRSRNVFVIIVMHPRSETGVKSGADAPCPATRELHHGSEWGKILDDIIFYHHPTFTSDRSNTSRELKFAKVKKQKISGKAQTYVMTWNYEQNRIYDFGMECGLDKVKIEVPIQQKPLTPNLKFDEPQITATDDLPF